MNVYKSVGRALVSFAATTFFLSTSIENGSTAAEPTGKGDLKSEPKEPDHPGYYIPETGYDYVKMVEPILGAPPKVDLGEAVEIPIYVDGVQAHGHFGYGECDNPSRIGKGGRSGSVLQRYEGWTADGKPLPDVVWVAFGSNGSYTDDDGELQVRGSVQLIGYHKKTGATAFFDSSDKIDSWVDHDAKGERFVGEMPWIDDPDEFNKAFQPPGSIQCVECHQNDPFIHNSFIDAAKIPGTDETVVPSLSKEQPDAPYYVIGGEDWDMRTIHIEGNGCFECHRVGMGTVKLFEHYHWDANEMMPPDDPGSLADDYQELLAAWERGPENTPGAEWIIPPARGTDRQIVGDDYPYKMKFNTPGNEAGTALNVEMLKTDGPIDLDELSAKLKEFVKDGKIPEDAAMRIYEGAASGKGKKK